jgi:ABC-2 type transport system ATP-binding protein
MIEVQELGKIYRDNTKALDGVSFNIGRGEVCGYLGANGAGKTTTIKILCGMLNPTSGLVNVGGYNVLTHPHRVKKMIGYVPESGAVIQSLTLYDFLEFVCKIYEVDKTVYVKRIYDFAELFDLKAELNSALASYSKGMRQKALIISSLIHNPDVIFWDEPLSGLDYRTIVLIQDIIKELSSSGKTFFYSSHILDLVEKICTQVIILDRGRKVFDSKIQGENRSSLEELFSGYIDNSAKESKFREISKGMTNK